jgi:aspartyl-tRNA(Asn)/glutamyl-tRNA(Gln) amidotransferase subunit A
VASVEALVTKKLSRISSINPLINAFIEIRAEEAFAAARQSDQQCAKGRARQPLEGMIVAFKDMFSRRGRLATFGSALGQQNIPTRNAQVIERLEGAGAVTVGFLNMSEFALGPTGHNRTFGHCRNPWNVDRVTGGSSSGAAAALAAGLIEGAIGSDTGGSIRVPAACCGVVGLKPTPGQISTDGAMALSWSLDCVGPLARDAIICARMFDAISASGAFGGDDFPLQRLVYPRDAIGTHTSGEIMGHLDHAMAVLTDLGFFVEYGTSIPDVAELHDLAATVQAFEACIVHAENLRIRRHLFTPHVLDRILPGLDISGERYIQALDQRPRRLWEFLRTTLTPGTVLVLPTLRCLVPTIAETDQEKLGALPDLVGEMTYWTRWLNYLGLPALSLPCGIDRNGMPIGMQLVGPPMADRTLLSIAVAYQRRTGVLTPAELLA